jgi:hypothetical protein
MRVLVAVFAREFYLTNTGFFLFVIAFASGFMRSHDHVALAEFFVSNPLVLSIPLIIWLFYTVKVMSFNRERLTLNQNEFIFCFILLPSITQTWIVLRIIAIQLVPVFLYGSFLCIVGSKHRMAYSVATVIMGYILLVSLSVYHLIWQLHHPNDEKKVFFLSRFLNHQFTKPFPLFFVEWVARHELASLAGTKIFSGLIIAATTAFYKTDTYDLRLLTLGILISAAANTGLVLSLHRFENFHVHWIRGLPFSIVKRIFFTLISVAIILFPEVILLLKNFPKEHSWYEFLNVILFLVSIPIFFYGISYVKDRSPEEIVPIVFYCVIAWFVLILFKVPALILGIVNVLTGLILWKRFYYSFEYVARKARSQLKNRAELFSE